MLNKCSKLLGELTLNELNGPPQTEALEAAYFENTTSKLYYEVF